MPRSNLWGLAVPALLVLEAVGVADVTRPSLEQLADLLDQIAQRCGPAAPSSDNPAKQVAMQLAGSLPYVWGSSDLAAVAAARFCAQLAENAKYPAVAGALTEVHHNQVVVMAGHFGSLATGDPADFFRDRVEDAAGALPRMRVVMLRDPDEVPEVGRRRAATAEVAERYDVAVDELAAEGDEPVHRLASLVAPLDFASVYLALLQGIDPTPIEPITALKASDREETP